MNLFQNKPAFLQNFKLDRSDFEWLRDFSLHLFNLESIKGKNLFQAVFVLLCAALAVFCYLLFSFQRFQVVLFILVVVLTTVVFFWLLKHSTRKKYFGGKI